MNESFWQGAGNGKCFDSFLGDNSKMNNRTIGILSYIKSYGFVNELIYKQEILNYLVNNFKADANDSLITHFYKPALFYGFIQKDIKKNLSLSIEGNLFLDNYQQKNYDKCQELIINQLDNTTFHKNQATPKSQDLQLFPFRILFKLLLEKGSLSQNFINQSLVAVTNIYDLKDIKSFDTNSSKFKKFNTWVISSLVDIKILDRDNNKNISINKDIRDYIKNLYKNLTYEDCFFENTICEVNQKVAKERYKRNPKFISEAKIRDNFQCKINNQHLTFISKGVNYVEGHHIVPMFQQKNYNFQLDDVDNIISLCPTCHREIHSADNKTDILRDLYSLNQNYMQHHNINLIDFHKMYLCI